MTKKKAAVKKTTVKKKAVEKAKVADEPKADAPKAAPKQLIGYSVRLVEGVKSYTINGASGRKYVFVAGKPINVTNPQDQLAFLTESKVNCTPLYGLKRQKV